MREKSCEAPFHQPDCPCVPCKRVSCRGCDATDKDHFQPKCIAKLIKNPDFGKPANFQWLSRPCHEAKDKSTAKRKNLFLLIQRSPCPITLEKYRIFRNEYDAVDVQLDK